MVAYQLGDAFGAVLEVDLRQEAVRWWTGGVVNPDAAAGVVDLPEEEAAGLDFWAS